MEGFKRRSSEEKKTTPTRHGGAQGFTRAMLLATLAAINAPESASANEFPKGVNTAARTLKESPEVHKKARAYNTHWNAMSDEVEAARMRDAHYALIKRMRGDYVQGGTYEKSVYGFNKFCEELSAYCREFAEQHPDRVMLDTRLTPELLKLIQGIHHEVNASVIPMTDIEQYQRTEKWTIPDIAGDCEDYALKKMLLLIRAGIDPKHLHILIVDDEKNEGHAVLGVDVREGDVPNTLVLDNKIEEIRTLAEMESQYKGNLVSVVTPELNGEARVGFYPYVLMGKKTSADTK